jgi:dihydropyrimidine dehydrogenase (NADP+)
MLLSSSRPLAKGPGASTSSRARRPRLLLAQPPRAGTNGSNGSGNGSGNGSSSKNASSSSHLDAPVALKDGAPLSGPSLSVTVNGLTLPNPFVIGSGPPGTNYQVMKRAFDDGWGAVICKTLSLDSKKVVNVTPRYAKLRDSSGSVFGWENMELISDRPFETMLDEIKRLKEEFPGRVLIASVMEECNKNAWEEILGRCQEAGADAFEINFSCPHGMPERRMGMAMGQDPELLAEVSEWIRGATK